MFTLSPIGVVRSGRKAPEDDYWGEAGATIELGPDVPAEALDGIDEYSHAEIFFILDRVAETATERWARHPRGNTADVCPRHHGNRNVGPCLNPYS